MLNLQFAYNLSTISSLNGQLPLFWYKTENKSEELL